MDSPHGTKSNEASHARDLLQSLIKAKKNLRLYPSNNPIYSKTVEDIYGKFAGFLDYRDSIDLRIGRNEIVFEGETVFQGDGKDENIALFFFRDGLREISFKKGLKHEELQEFLEIMSIDFDKEDVEDDIVTLLWEKDFPNIGYRVDDTVLVEDEEYEEVAKEQATEGAMQEEAIEEAYEEAMESGAEEEAVSVMPLSEEDLKALAALVEEDRAIDRNSKFVDILFDMFPLSDGGEEYKEIARILNSTLDFYVRSGDLANSVKVLRKAKEAAGGDVPEEVRKSLGIVLSYGGTSPIIKVIGDQLDSGMKVDEASFTEYVRHLGTNAIPSFVLLLGELESMAARKYAIKALAILGKRDLNQVLKGLRDARWYVVRNIVYTLRMIGDKAAFEHVARVSRHQDPRVRKEAMRAVGELGGEGAISLLKGFFEDPDKSVRLSAVAAIGSIGTEAAKGVVLESIDDRRFMSLDFDEMKAYFEALSKWADEQVVGFLTDILKKNPLLKTAKHYELKACAVFSLGLMGHKESLDLLEELRNSKNQVLGEHAYAAIKRIRYGR